MRRHILLCAFIAAVAAPAAQAEPLENGGVLSVAVRLDDLDLASEAGGATALRRIRQAASRACGGSSHHPDLVVLSRAFRRCRSDALAAAVERAAVPSIARAHAEGRAPRMALARR